jgi:spore coat polysaccharide biosynthesis protein SpsF
MVGIFLQARIDSSRLPRKVLLPLADKTVVEHALSALKQVGADAYVLLTDDDSYQELEPYARRWGFEIFAGPKDDVLSRYTQAARYWGADTIIRATGDNPLVSVELAEQILAVHQEYDADYSGFLGMPLGTGVEVVKTESLYRADAESRDHYEREHVSPFIYFREKRFKIVRPYVTQKYRLSDVAVTLDTEEDYQFITTIYDHLYNGEPIKILDLIQWLRQNTYAEQYQHLFT